MGIGQVAAGRSGFCGLPLTGATEPYASRKIGRVLRSHRTRDLNLAFTPVVESGMAGQRFGQRPVTHRRGWFSGRLQQLSLRSNGAGDRL